MSFAVGWLRGGHTERLAVTVLFWDHALTRLSAGMPGGHDLVGVSECMVALIFAWMAFRSDRWWVLAASAGVALCALVFILEWSRPDLHIDAAISARLGLWFFVHLSLLAGVAERWLAGDEAVSGGRQWRRRPPRRQTEGPATSPSTS